MARTVPTADFVTTTLQGDIAADATSMTIGSGLDLPATNGVLQIDYDSNEVVGDPDGPETVFYGAYNSGTGGITGMTRGKAGTTGVTHTSGASVHQAVSAEHLAEIIDGSGLTLGSLPSETVSISAIDNDYVVLAFKSSSASSQTSGVSQDIVYDDDSTAPNGSDPGNDFDTSTGEWTVPATGYYQVNASYLAYYSGTDSPNRADIYVQVKPSGGAYSTKMANGLDINASTSRMLPNVSGVMYLTAGDMVKAVASIYYASGAPYVYGDGNGQYTKFSAFLIAT